MAVRSDQLQHDRHQQGPERPGRRLDHMRVAQLLVAFEQREQRAQGEQHDSHQEGPEVAFAPETEGMRGRGRLTPPPAPEREQSLIAGVGHRVNRLGQHRGGTGEQERDELRDRDTEIGQERGQDRPGAALVHPSRPVIIRPPRSCPAGVMT
jgi:hypothetical protein